MHKTEEKVRTGFPIQRYAAIVAPKDHRISGGQAYVAADATIHGQRADWKKVADGIASACLAPITTYLQRLTIPNNGGPSMTDSFENTGEHEAGHLSGSHPHANEHHR
eukprot:2101146-Pyramimonas_sp.AAC.1